MTEIMFSWNLTQNLHDQKWNCCDVCRLGLFHVLLLKNRLECTRDNQKEMEVNLLHSSTLTYVHCRDLI